MSDLVPDSLSPAALEAFLHAKIPLTKAMGLRAIETGPRQIVLEAPLEPNINHLGSVFGGTLHALPTLACYASGNEGLVEGWYDHADLELVLDVAERAHRGEPLPADRRFGPR